MGTKTLNKNDKIKFLKRNLARNQNGQSFSFVAQGQSFANNLFYYNVIKFIIIINFGGI